MKGITRRDFVKSAGLTLAVAAGPAGLRTFAISEADTGADGFQPTVWYTVSPDNRLTVMVNKSEMGQGTHTAHAMIVADELGVKWDQVQIEQAPARKAYFDPPSQRFQGTGGSSGTRGMYEPLRQAAAAGREMLVEAAAGQWQVPVSDCLASEGKVHHRPSGRSLSYGELAEEASKLPVPETPRLKDKSEFKIMRTPIPRLDIPAKVNGQAQFGIDTFLPGMLYGSVARPPAYGAKAVSYDEKAAKAVPGVKKVVEIDRGIAVCADTLDAAWKGRKALNIQWDGGDRPSMSTETVDRDLVAGLDKEGLSARNDGDVQGALQGASSRVESDFHLKTRVRAIEEIYGRMLDNGAGD